MGQRENDMTRALGWTLASCPVFLRLLVHRLLPTGLQSDKINVQLQVWNDHEGYTDIELNGAPYFHLVLEAKRGWQPPTSAQLSKYAARLRRAPCDYKCLVILTDWSYSSVAAQQKEIGGIPVVWISWADALDLAVKARLGSRHFERLWIDELLKYIGGVVTMQDPDSNWAFVVSLGNGNPHRSTISWIDIVEKRQLYFHPSTGKAWPKIPPNYLAWRYNGKLQGIAHITGYKVLPDMHARIPEIPKGIIENHVLYTLGPTFRPDHDVRSGRLHNAPRRCMLDTLFTSATLLDAAKESQRRKRKAEPLAP